MVSLPPGEGFFTQNQGQNGGCRPPRKRQAAALWRFSLTVYGRAGVPAACLALQDEGGRDVNLLLYCCWVGASGLDTPTGFASAVATVSSALTGHVADDAARDQLIGDESTSASPSNDLYVANRIGAGVLDYIYYYASLTDAEKTAFFEFDVI